MKPLEDGLESMIEAGQLPAPGTPVGSFLAANPEARAEVVQHMDLSRLIRDQFSLSPEEQEDLAPAAGFYARVMSRIEAQAPPSIWSFFLQPLGMRIVYASLALAVLLFAATIFDGNEQDWMPQVATAPSAMVVTGAVLASNEDGIPLEESADALLNRGAALAELSTAQLTTYEQ
jgi:hypothetical protein